ncbi:MAG: hypothetical protein HW418_3490, partial [Anaerolineales bacterium]|nr:hypothetical protein [Anaerolineales bacterium]
MARSAGERGEASHKLTCSGC